MVLASVTLLVFFISMMVVERVRQKKDAAPGARAVVLTGKGLAAASANPLFSPLAPADSSLRETRTSEPASRYTFEWDHRGGAAR
jgi:hypothetical protein